MWWNVAQWPGRYDCPPEQTRLFDRWYQQKKAEYQSHLHQITEKSMTHDFTERFKMLTNGLDRGWQVDLSLRCGVTRPTITHWKSGRTKSASPAQLFAMADYFGVNARWLATGVGPKWLEAATSLENVSHVVNDGEPRVREC